MLRARAPLALLFLAMSLWSRHVPAAPKGADALEVAVVAVKSDDALDHAEALTQALRKAVRDSKGWSLGEATQSLEFLMVNMNCSEPIDAACEARIADVIKADRYLWAVLRFEDPKKKNVVGTLNFWVRGKGTNQVPMRFSANLTDANDDALVQVAKKAVDDVTGGAPQGEVKISAGGVAAQLFIDGRAVGALPAQGGKFKLPSGTHHIVVKAPGYIDAETSVTVRPSATSEASLKLIKEKVEKPPDYKLIGGIVALGGAAILGAVGLWQALEVNAIMSDERYEIYRAGIPEGDDVCERAEQNFAVGTSGAATPGEMQDLCSKAQTGEIIQLATFIPAAIAAGLGLYLIGTSDAVTGDGKDQPAEALVIEPILSPEVQALQVRYRF
jgi:hypothetical protein